MRLLLVLARLTIDLRLMSFTSLGCSIVYVRVDAGTRTLLQLDLERVRASHRVSAFEWLVRIGWLTRTNRSWYVG
jgi:hypothetical protein